MKSGVKKQNELRKFMKSCSYLGWYVNNPKDPGDIDAEWATQGVLIDGSFDDMQALIKIIGVKKMAEYFRSNIDKKWKAYFAPISINYLTLYFNHHAPQKS